MDLSKLKWPVIIIVVAGVAWLFSSAGVQWQYNKFTSSPPGVDPDRDKVNEAGLSRLGGFLMKTFRYTKADQVLSECCRRYPTGDNYWHNYYRLAKLAEKRGDYSRSVQILEDLIVHRASKIDPRVPEYGALRLRADKLIEVHELRRH